MFGGQYRILAFGRIFVTLLLLLFLASEITARPLVRDERGLVESARAGIQKVRMMFHSITTCIRTMINSIFPLRFPLVKTDDSTLRFHIHRNSWFISLSVSASRQTPKGRLELSRLLTIIQYQDKSSNGRSTAKAVLYVCSKNSFLQAKDYLRNFGWLPSWNPETWKESSVKIVKKATRLFQRFWGLQETGELWSEIWDMTILYVLQSIPVRVL